MERSSHIYFLFFGHYNTVLVQCTYYYLPFQYIDSGLVGLIRSYPFLIRFYFILVKGFTIVFVHEFTRIGVKLLPYTLYTIPGSVTITVSLCSLCICLKYCSP